MTAAELTISILKGRSEAYATVKQTNFLMSLIRREMSVAEKRARDNSPDGWVRGFFVTLPDGKEITVHLFRQGNARLYRSDNLPEWQKDRL